MHKTVGTYDRVVRGIVAVAAVIVAGVLGFTSGWGVLLLVVAAVMVVTGSTAYCPAYSLLHVDTCNRERGKPAEHGSTRAHQTTT